MHSISLPSYAKINIGLIIKGKRTDGFHEIETLLQQISLKDEIVLRKTDSPHILFHCDSPTLPRGDANLCVRAAKLLVSTFAPDRGVEIILHKQIPTGAGLGGGSSNAATVLVGLNTLWNLNLDQNELIELATQLGSDVPFFVRGGTALAQGKGDILTSLPTAMTEPILIVYPGFEIATKWAYEQVNLDLTMKKKSSTLTSFKDRNFNNVDFHRGFPNEFEDIVFKDYPTLREIKDVLIAEGAVFASMSGSGSSIFGIFETEGKAEQAKARFPDTYERFVVRPFSGMGIESQEAL